MSHSFRDPFLGQLQTSLADGSVLRRLGSHLGQQGLFTQQRPEVLSSLRERATVESVESSNRLEGITARVGRVEQLVLFSTEPESRSEQEIAGYRDALALIHESSSDMKLSENLILQLHVTINRYQPDPGGRWKAADNEIVEKDEKGRVTRVRFKAVSAVETPQAVRELVRAYDRSLQSSGVDPILAVPLVVLDFLCIHPFGDGNGRVARLLTLLLLYQSGYQVGRYISLERIFEATKESYYDTLEMSSHGWHEGRHDPMPWVRYFWGVLLRAYRIFEERVGTVSHARGAKTDQVRAAVSRRNLPFGIKDIEEDCPGVSRELVRKVLRKLRDEGVIVSEGAGRGARWRPTN